MVVSGGSRDEQAPDRGQLILVGAVAIAFVLMGLVLVVNTALFTQVVGSEGTVETAKEGGVTADSIGNNLGTVVAHENSEAPPDLTFDRDDIDSAVNSTEDDLEQAVQIRSLESGGAFVSLEYEGRTVDGSTISQDTPAEFTDATGDPDWSVINSSSADDVGGFQMTIHTDDSSFTNDFEVRITGATGDRTDIRVSENGGDVDIEVDGPPDEDCLGITPTNDTVHIDISHGRVAEDGDCQFDAFRNIEPGYSVEFRNGASVNGTYEIATSNGSITGNLDPRFSTDAGDPTRTVAVWAFEYSYTYDTPEATVTSDGHEVEVYD